MRTGVRRTRKERDIVSARAYARLLSDPWLRRAVIPGGLLSTPYEVLSYQSVLTLHNTEGTRATFVRRQDVRFLHDGVAAILDHAWGDGVLMTDYANDAGRLEGSYNDAGRRHLVVALRRRMSRGEILAFNVRREAKVGFTQHEEWLETTIDHPIAELRPRIVFPKERPCRRAVLEAGTRRVSLPVCRRRGGQTMVQAAIPHPRANVPYMIRWSW
jgi:hypothetical protein